MLKINIYGVDNPLEDMDALIPLIQRQMEAIGLSKSKEEVQKALLNAMKPGSSAVLFVGFADNLTVAFAFGNIGAGLASGGRYFWLNEVHVDAEHRGLGYGSEILSGIESWLIEQGICTIAGVTGHDNEVAQTLFKNQGYEKESLLWVEKRLNVKM